MKTTTTMCLADIVRHLHGDLSRNQLKVARARLRRAGVTGGGGGDLVGPYRVNPHVSHVTDPRADFGAVVVTVAAVRR